MGCDIHVFIEYRNNPEDRDDTFNEWRNFGQEFSPGRDYTMFSILAKVRGNFPKSFDRKGMVDFDTMGWRTKESALMRISEHKGEDEGYSVPIEVATKYNKRYGSKLYRGKNYNGFSHVDHPDNHSFSWLTTSEYEQALDYYRELSTEYHWNDTYGVQYEALLSVMKTLEKNGEYIARIVFWFDN